MSACLRPFLLRVLYVATIGERNVLLGLVLFLIFQQAV
jgi:hypothetical protein